MLRSSRGFSEVSSRGLVRFLVFDLPVDEHGEHGAPVRGGGLSADLGAENGGCVYLLEDGAECGLFLYAPDCTQLEMSLALEPEPDAPGLPEPYSVFQRADG